MQILTLPEAETPTHLRQQVLELQDEAWPSTDAPQISGTTHDPHLAPLSMLLVDNDVVLAALDILRKDIEHAGTIYRAGGLSTVVSRRATRRSGHGGRLVRAAHAAMADLGLDVGLFTCDLALKPFYEACGWRELVGTVLIGGTPAEPFPSDQPGFDKVTMGDFFSSMVQAHADRFLGSRIAVFPGTIDRLW